jgi:membrane protease YdiL (CAAX protease family)
VTAGAFTPARVDHAPDQRTLALVVGAAGCLALAARPSIRPVAIGVTIAVGIAGALAPSIEDRSASGLGAIVVTALGIGAFAIVRAARPLPPTPVAGAGVVVAAAIAEEIFFRRFLYGALLGWGAAAAVVGSALAFALIHVPAYGTGVFPLDLAAGFLLSWQRWATGSWAASAASHAAANLMVIW